MVKDLEARYKFACEVSQQLAKMQLEFNHDALGLERKGDDSPVTVADQKSEQFFRDAVAQAFPEDHVFGEEQGGDEIEGCRWVIDPIDGTRKFMRSMPFWSVCIAFESEEDMEIGVVTIPGQNRMQWSALRGQGAFLDGKAIQVDNDIQDLSRAFLTMPARPYFEEIGMENHYDELQRRIEHDPGFLDALSYGFVADGRLHGLMSCADQWWDIAAPICIIREAGGIFTNLKGQNPEAKGINFAASPAMHDLLMKWSETI